MDIFTLDEAAFVLEMSSVLLSGAGFALAYGVSQLTSLTTSASGTPPVPTPTSSAQIAWKILLALAVMFFFFTAVIWAVVHVNNVAERSTMDNGGNSNESVPQSDFSADDLTHVSVFDLGSSAGEQTYLIFGRLSEVVLEASARGVTPNVDPKLIEMYPERCVSTLIYGPTSGETGTILAEGYGAGWNGAEFAPSQTVAADEGLLHQQFISPPPQIDTGATFSVGASISIDGDSRPTGLVDLALLSQDGMRQIWQFGINGMVSCEATIP